MAFYFAGRPKQMQCYSNGAQTWTDEHSYFVGADVTEKDAYFSYGANWDAQVYGKLN